MVIQIEQIRQAIDFAKSPNEWVVILPSERVETWDDIYRVAETLYASDIPNRKRMVIDVRKLKTLFGYRLVVDETQTSILFAQYALHSEVTPLPFDEGA